MQEQISLTTIKPSGCIEEQITIDGENLLYSLSNSLEDIEIAIFQRTEQNINLKAANWTINKRLASSVKLLMKKYQSRYSYVIRNKSNTRDLVVNMHANDEWFITGFTELDNSFYSWDALHTAASIRDAINEYSKKSTNKDQRKKHKITMS